MANVSSDTKHSAGDHRVTFVSIDQGVEYKAALKTNNKTVTRGVLREGDLNSGQVGSLAHVIEKNFSMRQSETQRFIEESRYTFKREGSYCKNEASFRVKKGISRGNASHLQKTEQPIFVAQ